MPALPGLCSIQLLLLMASQMSRSPRRVLHGRPFLTSINQPIAALDRAPSRAGRSVRWRTVHNVVVEVHRQAQLLAGHDPSVDDGRFGADTTHRDAECMGGQGQSPATSRSKHANRSQRQRAKELLPFWDAC